MIKNLIYGLRDPRNDIYRYIGKTSIGEKRPLTHLKKSHNDSVNQWVCELNSVGLEPFVDILEEVKDINNLADRERFFIAYYSDLHSMLLNGNRSDYDSINQPSMVTHELLITTYNTMVNMGEVYKLVKINTNFSDELIASTIGVGRKVMYCIKKSKTSVTFNSYLKLVFFAKVGIDGLFNYFYNKSNEFKGATPDTKQEFINICMINNKFSNYWFSKMFEEEGMINKIEYTKRSPKRK